MKWANIPSYELLYNSLLGSKYSYRYSQKEILDWKIYKKSPVFKELKSRLCRLNILDSDIKKNNRIFYLLSW